MCGIVGVIAGAGRRPQLSDAELDAWRDTLTHRGPDGAGSWAMEQVALGHRRLAIRDLSDAAAQPMLFPGGRRALAYNGELYNDAELRAELREFAARFGGFRTACDAETVLFALAAWGAAGLERLRGIFALAYVDLDAQEVLLARDPLGVKPLYWGWFGGELLFASEPKALLSHPRASAQPDLGMVSAYLTTARRELGGRTMFEGVRSVLPGEVLRVDLNAAAPEPVRLARWTSPPVGDDPGAAEAARLVAAALTDSTTRQLVSDRPVCALLSGGLDSSILVHLALSAGAVRPRTWCSGGVDGDVELGPDPAAAREVAAALGTEHHFAPVDRTTFLREWSALVEHLGTPLATPNEVAISEVARRLREGGDVVALSGEGADELFGGYDAVLDSLAAAARATPPIEPGVAHLGASTWVAPALKPALFGGDALPLIEDDALLHETFVDGFQRCAREAGAVGDDDPERVLQGHLRLQREINLASLLQRLDATTMRHGVEGRTPFADVRVAELAESLPMIRKYAAAVAPSGVPVSSRGGSKRVLRDAFSGALPRVALERPKASFPLPFQEWAAEIARGIGESPFARALFVRSALAEVASNPEERWRVAWPLANLALWGDRIWG